MKKRKTNNLEKLIPQTLIVVSGLFFYLTRSWEKVAFIMGFLLVSWLIVSILVQRNREKKLRQSGIEDIDKMDGIQFEHYLSTLFKQQGYKVEVTQATGDYGADLLLKKEDVKIVVQAKRYAKKVGIKAIQEISASKLHYDATDSWVVTNNYYTKAAIELAASNKVKLIDRNSLVELILKNAPREEAIKLEYEIDSSKVYCPRCNNEMILRKGKKGDFYGCSRFPKCRGTKEIEQS